MAHDMEFVEQDRHLWRIGIRRQTEWLPHVHHRQANARALPLAKPVVELAHACLRTVLAAEPDRPATHEVADHDPVAVTFADRKLVDADHLRSGRASTLELRFHVLLLQHLHRLPVQRQFLRHVLDRRLPAAAADKVSKALGVERISHALSDYQKCRALSVAVESRGTNMHPTAAAFASLFVPSN